MVYDHKIVSHTYWIARIVLTIAMPGFGFFLSIPFMYIFVPSLREYLLSLASYQLIAIVVFMGFLWFALVYLVRTWSRTFFVRTVEGPIEKVESRWRPVPFTQRWLRVTVDGDTYRIMEQSNLSQLLKVGMDVALEVDSNSLIRTVEW